MSTTTNDNTKDPLFVRDPEWFARYKSYWHGEQETCHLNNCRTWESECYCMHRCGICAAPEYWGPGHHEHCPQPETIPLETLNNRNALVEAIDIPLWKALLFYPSPMFGSNSAQ